MKIEYHKNPLYTKVLLDDHEKEIFRWRIRVEELTESLSNAHFTLTHHDWYNKLLERRNELALTIEQTVAKAVEELDPDYYTPEDGKPSPLDERVEELVTHYLAELVDRHVGDCTCVACSCSKCHAESVLGVDTIPGLGKHAAYKIDAAFGKDNEKAIDEVLEYLQNYEPSEWKDSNNPRWTKADHDKHIPRWRAEGQAAYTWLLNYRNTHFKD